MNVGFAMCGSFCTYSAVFPVLEALCREHTVIPILSDISCSADSRFCTAAEHLKTIAHICGRAPLCGPPDRPAAPGPAAGDPGYPHLYARLK